MDRWWKIPLIYRTFDYHLYAHIKLLGVLDHFVYSVLRMYKKYTGIYFYQMYVVQIVFKV